LSTSDLPDQQSLKAHGSAWRLFSASEVLLGAVIVIGHNVFHVVPNEVPILFVLGLVSVRLRDGRWSAIGFRRPKGLAAEASTRASREHDLCGSLVIGHFPHSDHIVAAHYHVKSFELPPNFLQGLLNASSRAGLSFTFSIPYCVQWERVR
jgi:hypothetical protein